MMAWAGPAGRDGLPRREPQIAAPTATGRFASAPGAPPIPASWGFLPPAWQGAGQGDAPAGERLHLREGEHLSIRQRGDRWSIGWGCPDWGEEQRQRLRQELG